jgi:methionyl aminopeptidase
MRPRGVSVKLKSPQEIELMRVAASTTSEILDELVDMVEPGVSTWDLDQAAEQACRRRGVTPAFKGLYGFPACLCVAVNDVVVHGIPSKACVLKDGDIIGLDFGVVYRGWYGDHARTILVGSVDAESKRLVDATAESLAEGIAACQPGARLRDIGKAVQRHAEGAGYAVVRDFMGHGIGRRLHEEPPVSNYYDRRQFLRLRAGMVLCVEPMVNMGSIDVEVLEDNWTAVTRDGQRSAHFEHTIAITESGPEILSISGHGV